jgi:RNA polymerase sigma-70 factor (ECF subfamily)
LIVSNLIFRVAAGDAGALTELYRRHRSGTYSLCLHMTADADEAEDLTQEVFLRVIRSAPGFKGDSSEETWLYRIARNICIDSLRAAERRASAGSANRPRAVAAAAVQEPEPTPRLSALEMALGRLAVEDREVIVLAKCVGLGSERLGEVFECTAGTARVRLHRALTRLRELCVQLEGPCR